MNHLTKRISDGCEKCLIFDLCGGIKNPLLGTRTCYPSSAEAEEYDDEMSPNNPLFWRLWDDVGGLANWNFPSFQNTGRLKLPKYVPLVRNGCRRISLMDEGFAAISLFKVIGQNKGGIYGSRYADGKSLRRAFKLQPNSKILLVGVSDDPPLELFWKKHKVSNVFEELKLLGISGVTMPNFSAFEDAPKFQVFRNMKRMLLAAERFSEWGILIVPHLTAIDPSQWRFWKEFLQLHPEIKMVCKEFQTGFKLRSKGMEAMENLSHIQDVIGRDLHPILVGGGSLYLEAQKRFNSFSVIDSRPHMLSMGRILLQAISEKRYREVSVKTPKGQAIDDLYRENNRVHFDNIRLGRRKSKSRNDPGQAELDFSTSMPYLIAHPAA